MLDKTRIKSIVRLATRLIAEFEGFSTVAYLCPAGVWTIGYGTTTYLPVFGKSGPVKEGDRINELEAAGYLEEECKALLRKLYPAIKDITLSDAQIASLLSFSYNVGINALLGSKLLKEIRSCSSRDIIKSEWMRWVHANKKVLQGLVNRRKREVELFLISRGD
jgi:lysozyme